MLPALSTMELERVPLSLSSEVNERLRATSAFEEFLNALLSCRIA